MGRSLEIPKAVAMISRRLGTALAAMVLGLGTFAAGVAEAVTVNCGDSIVQSTVLDSDIGPCPGNGIVVAGDHVALDLGGHTVRGAGEGAGIQILGRFAQVRNGSVTGFGAGVSMGRSFSGVERLLVAHNGVGVTIIGGELHSVLDSVIRDNAAAGVSIFRSKSNLIDRSVVSQNGLMGVDIESFFGMITRASGNRVTRSALSGNGGDGVRVTAQSFGTAVDGNLIAANGGNGVYVAGGRMEAFVRDNIVLGNQLNGVLVDGNFGGTGVVFSNSVASNTARDNGVQSGSFDLADRNPACAGTLWSGNTFLTRNQACIN